MKNGYSDNLSIDRINNNGDYCPENCRWASREVQANNTRKNVILLYKGESKTISQWAKELNVKSGTLSMRYRRGWTVEDIIEIPVGEKKIN